MESRTVEPEDRTSVVASEADCRMVAVVDGCVGAVAACGVEEVWEEDQGDDEGVDGSYYVFGNPLDNCCTDCFPYCVRLLLVGGADDVASKSTT